MGLRVSLAGVLTAVSVFSGRGSLGSPWPYVVAGTWCTRVGTSISLGICTTPCSRICRFLPPDLLGSLPAVAGVEDVVVVGISTLVHTVAGCGRFHGRVYRTLDVSLLDHTWLQPVTLAPVCSISSLGLPLLAA